MPQSSPMTATRGVSVMSPSWVGVVTEREPAGAPERSSYQAAPRADRADGAHDLREWPAVKLLRTVLYLDAVVWAVTGVLLLVLPGTVLEDVFDQVPLGEYVWVRMAAILGVGVAMLMFMVAHRIETLWWFAWAFVLTEGALVLLSVLNATLGLPEGSAALLWWLFAGVSAGFAAAMLVGLAKAGLERQPD